MMVIDNKYEIGQTVYLATDKEQLPRMVTGLYISLGSTIYHLSQGTHETKHYDIEIRETRNIVLTTEG